MNRSLSRLLFVATMAGAGAAAGAHDIVLVPSPDGVVVRYGHPGDWQTIDERKLVDLRSIAADGQATDRLAALLPQAKELVWEAPAATREKPLMYTARYDNGLWARVPVAGSDKPRVRNASRLMAPDAALVTANLKFAKALVATRGDGGLFRRPIGDLLEIVPQTNPATVAPGAPLDVRVLLQGRPLAGAGVEVGNLVDVVAEDRIVRYPTDARGIARLPLRDHGLHVLAVDVERDNDGSLGPAAAKLGADKLVLVATLAFVR